MSDCRQLATSKDTEIKDALFRYEQKCKQEAWFEALREMSNWLGWMTMQPDHKWQQKLRARCQSRYDALKEAWDK